jgi:hypothetical protein
MTLSITMLCYCAKCHYAERHILFTIMLNVIMMSVVMLSVFMLSLVAPQVQLTKPPPLWPWGRMQNTLFST